MKTETNTTKTAAAILVDAANKGNVPMDELTAALAEADSHATGGAKASKPANMTPNTWALLSQSGPFATKTATDGHRRLFKGLIPRLPASDAAKVRKLLAHYGAKV